MWKLKRIAQISFEVLKTNPKKENIEWLDFEIQKYIYDVGGECKYCFWEGKYYINIPRENSIKSIYLPFKTKYNEFIVINENKYPKKIERLEATINLIDRLIYKYNNWIS